MSYLNRVVRRTRPATRCQCAVLAVLTEVWADVDTIWRRHPVYADNQYGRVRNVAYGTVCAALRGLVQQGYVEVRGATRKQYREAAP